MRSIRSYVPSLPIAGAMLLLLSVGGTAVAQEVTVPDFWTMLIRGIPAGWLIAMIVWLRAAKR